MYNIDRVWYISKSPVRRRLGYAMVNQNNVKNSHRNTLHKVLGVA